jgi:AhpC/TSA family protein/cytochrome c biogenesis DsbD-like protein
LEQSRPLIEKEGLRLAAVSYDSQETLQRFAEKYRIRFPLLSDPDSAVIRSFGILNTNIAPGLRAHGVPHPVEYLIAPDGVVIRKYFVPNYQHRVTASAVVLREFGVASDGAPTITLRSGALTVEIGLSTAKAFAGQEISFFAKFTLQPGWHVYGSPLPQAYTATSVAFEDPKIVRQSFELPLATPMHLAALGETIPVYTGSFRGVGSLLLKFPLEEGNTVLSGRARYQQCSDTVCESPEALPFELPLTLDPFVVARPHK